MAERRGCLGCSFPLLITIVVILLGLLVVAFLAGPIGATMFGDIGLPDWIKVATPHPELPGETVFHIGGFPIANSVVTAWVTILFLVGISYAVTRRLKLVPGRLQGAFEGLLGWLHDFCVSAAGEENGRKFFPIVTTIFLFVAFNAWLGLLPGYGTILINNGEHMVHLFRPANTDINTPLALALVSFFYVWFIGFRVFGFKYLSKFFPIGPVIAGHKMLFTGNFKGGLSGIFLGFIGMFIGILELLSEFIRIISFTFRLFGNMTAGEILLLVAMFLLPYLFALPFYGLELLVGFIQALIFGGLTLIFLTVAVSHEEAH